MDSHEYWWREVRSGTSFEEFRLLKGNTEVAVLFKWSDGGWVWADKEAHPVKYEAIRDAENADEAKAFVVGCIRTK